MLVVRRGRTMFELRGQAMDAVYDNNLIARLLLTLVTAGYCIGLNVADMNATHAKNPMWTPHARFHVVWQVLSYTGLALIALALIWFRGPFYVGRLYVAAGLAATIFVSFFAAQATLRLYDGARYDTNGYLPKPVTVAGKKLNIDANTTVFTVLSVLLAAGFLAISPA